MQALLNPPVGVLAAFNHHFAASSTIHWIVAYERYPKHFARFRTVRGDADVGVLLREAEQRAYKRFWRYVCRKTSATEYGDAAGLFLGSYVDEYEAGQIEEVMDDFRALFLGKRLLFVCPETPLGGLSFPAQELAMKKLGLRSAKFLIIPNSNAFCQYASIKQQLLRTTGI